MVVTEAYVKRVTAIGGLVVTMAAFASPMRVTRVFGTPVYVTGGEYSARDRVECG